MIKKTACKFYGGPKHGEVENVDPLQETLWVSIPESILTHQTPDDFPKIAKYLTGRYQLMRDTIIIWPRPWIPEQRYCYVFAGFE